MVIQAEPTTDRAPVAGVGARSWAPAFVEAVAGGMAGHVRRPSPHSESTDDIRRRLLIVSGLGVPVVVLTALPVLQFDYWQWLSLSLTAPAVAWGAWPLHRGAWDELRRVEPSTGTLVSVSSVVGFAWSAWALFFGGAGGPMWRQGLGFDLSRLGDGRPLYLAAVAVAIAAALVTRYLRAAGREADHPGRHPTAPVLLTARRSLAGAARPVADFGLRRIVDLIAPSVVVAAAITLGFWLAASGDGAAASACTTAVLLLAYPVGLGLARSVPFQLGARRLTQLGMEVDRPEVLPIARRVDTIVLRKHGTLTTGRLALVDGHSRQTLLALADAVRPTAARAVSALRDLGVRPVLLTADRRHVGDPVAAAVGIDDVVSGVPASDTAATIARLQSDGRVVAVMGDRTTEATILARADLGIAYGRRTDVIGVTHPSLERTELWTAVDAIRLGRMLDHVVRSNVILATAVNVGALPLAASGRLSAAGLLAVMALSAGVVAANSLRLRRFRRLRPPAHRRAAHPTARRRPP